MEHSRRQLLRLAGAGLAGLAGCAGGGTGGDATATQTGTATDDGADPGYWRRAELTDVRTGETFTVAGESGPVLLHTFAVWCPVCGRQHGQLQTVHERSDATLVSLNVDPNEDRQKVREYAADNGYEWRFVVVPSAVTESLIAAFGPSVASAPSASVIVDCPDRAASLVGERGVKSAQDLLAALEC